MRSECAREAELLDALQTTAWPDCCPADLRAHVGQCRSCEDLAAIVLPLLDEHRAATLEAGVPSSAIVWWRAQQRARLEALSVAARPITVVQWLSAACAAGLLAAAIGYVSPALRESLARAWSMVSGIMAPGAGALSALPWAEMLVSPVGAAAAIGLTMTLLLAPLAIYLARD